MNIVIIGMFISNMNSIIGSMYISISHGIISTSLFILIGILYRRYKTKIILYYRGLSNIMILFSIFFFIMIISNVSFPLTSGFIGELLLLIGIQNYSIITSLLILLGLLITTAFNFKILIKLLFGRLSIYIKKYKDLTINEFLSLFPLLLLNLILGIYCLPLIKLSYLSLLKLL
jgi:NADH-quinone oxidoreductase subunit M